MNQSKGSGMAIASLVLGIVAIVTSLLWIISVPAGILAVIFGALTLKTAHKSKALAGLITGAVGIVLTITFIVVALAVGPSVREYQNDKNNGINYSSRD